MHITTLEYTSIIIILIIIIIISYVFVAYPDKRKIIVNYFDIFGGVSLVFLIITYFTNSYKDRRQMLEKTFLYKKNQELSAKLNLDKLFIDNYPYLNRLYSEFYPELEIKEPADINQDKRYDLEIYVCNAIIDAIDNMYDGSDVSKRALRIDIENYFRSPTLRKFWDSTYMHHSKEFIDFVHSVISSETKRSLS